MEQGSEIDKIDDEGWTALHWAAQQGYADVVTILMAYGASLTARANDGRLPIDVAANDTIRVLIHDEPSRRMDHGYKRDPNLDEGRKRAVIPNPDAEKESKRPRHEGEGEGQSSASAPLTEEELKYEEEVNGDSASSDEDEIDETTIRYRHMPPDESDKSV